MKFNIFKKKKIKKKSDYLEQKGLLLRNTIVPSTFLKDTHTPIWDDKLYSNKIYI